MTKAETISKIAKSTGLDKQTIGVIVESFMEIVKDSLSEGDNVYFRGFGSFVVKHRAEKKARNISKNITITIPARNVATFKPAKSFLK